MSDLDDAIAAVSAEVEQELTGTPEDAPKAEETAPEPAAEETPAETSPESEPEPEKPTEEPSTEEKPARERGPDGRFLAKDKEPESTAEEDEEDEPLGLTAEELAAVNADERLARVYKSMQRGLTKKTTSVAESRKALEERGKLVDWLQDDPDAAIRAMASARGIRLADDKPPTPDPKAVSDTADELEALYTETFGEENKVAAGKLRALFEKTAEKALTKQFNADIAQLKEQVEEHNKAAAARGITAAKQEFEAKIKGQGGEWSEAIENEMAAQAGRMDPGEGVTIDEFLQDVYDIVIHRRAQKTAKRDELKRLRRVKSEQEPTTSVRPTKETEVDIAGLSEKDAIEAATAWALQQSKNL